ncbi:hypothetical protein [Oceanospirillum sediminis]|uniref:Uncharacterized protein n=1 Tax=Oceanospirillum sediminis TaxID=2760088 RepID=A0A839IUL2_9GAMM|nr:hypothetical protein [Oceanospirillum sediminis]MBB1488631.1 hypothetical protein [Oceanospirillum sediminis]
MQFKIKLLLGLLFALLSASASAQILHKEKKAVLEQDSRNTAVAFSLTTTKKQLNFCVHNLTEQGSAMDVFRVFLHTAAQLKDRSFDQVNLCFKKEPRFVLSGQHFSTLGEELGIQNPAYTLRTFPEKLKKPDGQQAFNIHQGGMLYLMRAQMNDFNHMNEEWYLEDLVKEREAKKDALRPRSFAPDAEVF